jgi:hypothetical protein
MAGYDDRCLCENAQNKTAGVSTGRSRILAKRNQTAAVIHCCSFCFGAAPT